VSVLLLLLLLQAVSVADGILIIDEDLQSTCFLRRQRWMAQQGLDSRRETSLSDGSPDSSRRRNRGGGEGSSRDSRRGRLFSISGSPYRRSGRVQGTKVLVLFSSNQGFIATSVNGRFCNKIHSLFNSISTRARLECTAWPLHDIRRENQSFCRRRRG
jgi:hypothetical protein